MNMFFFTELNVFVAQTPVVVLKTLPELKWDIIRKSPYFS